MDCLALTAGSTDSHRPPRCRSTSPNRHGSHCRWTKHWNLTAQIPN